LALYRATNWCPSPSGSACSSTELGREGDGESLHRWWGASSQTVFVDVLKRLLLIASLPIQLCSSDSHTHFAEQRSPVHLAGERSKNQLALLFVDVEPPVDLQGKQRGLEKGRHSLKMLTSGLRPNKGLGGFHLSVWFWYFSG